MSFKQTKELGLCDVSLCSLCFVFLCVLCGKKWERWGGVLT